MNDRDERLLQLMNAAIPPVDDAGDWGEVSLRAAAATPGRRLGRGWRLVPAALGVAALMTVLAVLLVQATDTGKVEPSGPQPGEPVGDPLTLPSPLTYSILTRPRMESDTFPEVGPSQASDFQVDTADARLAVTREGVRYFVARRTTGELCLLRVAQRAPGFGLGCRDDQTLPDRAGWLITEDGLAAAIPDGFDRATWSDGESTVENNVLVVTPGITGSTVRLHGDGGAIDLPIPALAPSGTPTVPSPPSPSQGTPPPPEPTP